MIYLDSCALIKFIKQEPETDALRAWRQALPSDTELLTSELSQLEITCTLLWAGVDHQRAHVLSAEPAGITRLDPPGQRRSVSG